MNQKNGVVKRVVIDVNLDVDSCVKEPWVWMWMSMCVSGN